MSRIGRKRGAHRPEIDKDGYRVVAIPKGHVTHSRRRKARMILEHRLVMELHIGRPLSSNEIVHHLNEDKLDNRIENLQIVTRHEHAKMHDKGNGKCSICGSMFAKNNHRQLFCSSKCNNRSSYLSRASKGYFRTWFVQKKLAEKRCCLTCDKPLGLVHRNRDYCSPACDPWH